MINSKYATYLEQSPVFKPLWRAALYIRLSKEDGDKGESNSVTSQREILKEYLKLHPDIELYDIYVDDDENYEEDEDGNQLSSCDVLNKKYEVIANIKFLDIVDLIEEIKKLNLK